MEKETLGKKVDRMLKEREAIEKELSSTEEENKKITRRTSQK